MATTQILKKVIHASGWNVPAIAIAQETIECNLADTDECEVWKTEIEARPPVLLRHLTLVVTPKFPISVECLNLFGHALQTCKALESLSVKFAWTGFDQSSLTKEELVMPFLQEAILHPTLQRMQIRELDAELVVPVCRLLRRRPKLQLALLEELSIEPAWDYFKHTFPHRQFATLLPRDSVRQLTLHLRTFPTCSTKHFHGLNVRVLAERRSTHFEKSFCGMTLAKQEFWSQRVVFNGNWSLDNRFSSRLASMDVSSFGWHRIEAVGFHLPSPPRITQLNLLQSYVGIDALTNLVCLTLNNVAPGTRLGCPRLVHFHVYGGQLEPELFRNLLNLRCLELENVSFGRGMWKSVAQLSSLHTLRLTWCRDDALDEWASDFLPNNKNLRSLSSAGQSPPQSDEHLPKLLLFENRDTDEALSRAWNLFCLRRGIALMLVDGRPAKLRLPGKVGGVPAFLSPFGKFARNCGFPCFWHSESASLFANCCQKIPAKDLAHLPEPVVREARELLKTDMFFERKRQ